MRWAKAIKWPLSLAIVLFVASWLMLPWPGLSVAATILIVVSSYALVQVLVFYRDPIRTCRASETSIVAPADGRVVAIEEIVEPRYIKGPALRIAIFMHVGNVHIQRMPIEAVFKWQKHYPGKYLPAFDNRAAKVNEQRVYAFDRYGQPFTLVQIAGLLARRTKCWLTDSEQVVKRNKKIGMITLGSEIDLYLPLETSLAIKVGDKVFAGQSIIGEWSHE